MNLYKPEKSEELHTILASILSMPEIKRHEFYKSIEGKNILDGLRKGGLEMTDTSELPDGAEKQYTKEELQEQLNKLYEASEEQRHAILSLLPGPVVSVLLDALKDAPKLPDTNERAVIKGMDFAKAVGGTRGPVKGTAGYESWIAKLRASRAAKKLANAGSHPYKKEGFKKRNYKHFVRKVGEHAEISDSPSGTKS